MRTGDPGQVIQTFDMFGVVAGIMVPQGAGSLSAALRKLQFAYSSGKFQKIFKIEKCAHFFAAAGFGPKQYKAFLAAKAPPSSGLEYACLLF